MDLYEMGCGVWKDHWIYILPDDDPTGIETCISFWWLKCDVTVYKHKNRAFVGELL
jgi:hypothetical protein